MRRSRSSQRPVWFSVCIACACSALWAAPLRAEPSLAQMLRPAPVQRDPSAELSQQLSRISRRQFASDPAVQRALARVRQELARLAVATQRPLAAQTATDAAASRRRIAIIWAALSWADRLEARARTAAALAGLAARAREAEAAAQRAREVYDRAQAVRREKPSAPEGEPTPSTEAGEGSR